MNKIAVIYYSMSGNVEYVVKKIEKELDVDLMPIIPKKDYPKKGFKKFFWGGKSSVMKETPTLEEYHFDASQYDEIIIGTPVWASSFAPPIRTFIKENKEKLKEKKISVIICYSGGGAKKAIEKLKEYIGIKEFQKELILIDPKEKETTEKKKDINHFIQTFKRSIK